MDAGMCIDMDAESWTKFELNLWKERMELVLGTGRIMSISSQSEACKLDVRQPVHAIFNSLAAPPPLYSPPGSLNFDWTCCRMI